VRLARLDHKVTPDHKVHRDLLARPEIRDLLVQRVSKDPLGLRDYLAALDSLVYRGLEVTLEVKGRLDRLDW